MGLLLDQAELSRLAVDYAAGLDSAAGRTDNPLRFWRETARKFKCRWRESAAMLRIATDERQHPAGAHDHELAKVIDNDVMDQLTPADIRFYSAHATVSAKPKPPPKKTKAKAEPAAARAKRGAASR